LFAHHTAPLGDTAPRSGTKGYDDGRENRKLQSEGRAMWDSMFIPDVSILEKILRPFVVYLFLLVSLRLAGKRELAALNAMDLIVLLTLSNTVQNAIIGPDNSLSGGLIGATALLAVNYVAVRFLFNHPQVDRLVEGSATPLVEQGNVLWVNMGRELVTRPELESAAHKQGFASLDQVTSAVLEPSGVISFVGKEPSASELHYREITRHLQDIAQRVGQLQAGLTGR
jgi:uncharacterized membrane protein YcaP (DUF421 family)